MFTRRWIAVLATACALVATPAFGQGGSTASLSGVVTDKDGGVVPGATVVIKNTATGESNTTVTNASGAWSLPGLSVGAYKVTITLAGFKTAETDVRLQAGSQNQLQTKLEVGALSEVVTVSAGTDLIRTQTPTVSSTINADFITTLPRADRNALNFLIFLPGVQTIGGAGSARNSTVSGLPQNTINITIDGISNSNLLQSGDGFFSMVVPRLDAVEEVTMTTATAGANATGQGAVQIAFQTRSGTNRFETSLYSYNQHRMFNSNTFFNRLNGNPVPEATNFTYGGRVGGPIIIPGLFDGRGKAFFFFNYEEVYNPIETPRARTIIRQSALNGNFTYNQTTPTTVNVLALAAANGQISSYDPTTKALLESIRQAASTTGTISEVVTSPNTAAYNYLVPNKGVRHNPVTSITVNITPNHRLQGAYHYQAFSNTPDTLNNADARFPGFPAYGDQVSTRTSGSITLRSTLSSSKVNELRGGWQSSPLGFFDNATPDMFANQGGYALALGFDLTAAHPGAAAGPSQRNTIPYSIDNTFSWLKGSHSMSFGGNFTRLDDWADNWNNVPAITMGFVAANDPAEFMFTAANFPGSSNGDRNSARALYALLTGRVSQISATGRLNEAGTEYVYNGHAVRRERMDEYALFAQDQWRWKPTVTITAGLRYQLQMPMKPTNGVFTANTIESACGPSGLGSGPHGIFCNIFNPGVLNNPTVVPEFYQYSANVKGYDTDYNNVAPNIGAAWRPNVQDGFLRKLFGDPEIATLSAGYSRSYNRERVDRFLNVYSGNPGQTTPATRGTGNNQFPLVLPGETWPLLYSQKSRLGPPAFQTEPKFPVIAAPTNDLFVFDPAITIPYTDSWSVAFQRAIDKNTVGEVRYIGNRNIGAWIDGQGWNDANIYENNFLREFELAQDNLHQNVLAGRGSTFAYFGQGSGTSPLPIFLAHLNALPAGAASNPASYTGTGWTNSNFTSRMDPYNPNPEAIANGVTGNNNTPIGLYNSGNFFNNAKSVGYPINFWVMNPLVDEVNVTKNNPGGVRNHQFIGELRRRLSAGLAVQGSYTFSRQRTESIQDLHLPLFDLQNTGVPHAFKMIWTYDIPYGRGKRYGANISPWVDYIVGGWVFSGAGRVQVQSFVLRDAVIVGMSHDEAREALKQVRFVPDPVTGAMRVYNFPQDIIDQTRRAYNTDETQPTFYAPGTEPTGRYFAPAGGPDCNFLNPGDCGTADLWFRGRWFGEFDFRLAKSVPVKTARVEVSAEVFNALMAKNFPTQLNPGTGDIFRITSTQSGARTAQLVFRVSW
jgi:hypothetical protein